MTTAQKIKLVNQGYMMGISNPDEFKSAIQKKLDELKTNSKERGRWSAISHGFELAVAEQKRERETLLKKIKKTRGQSKERSR